MLQSIAHGDVMEISLARPPVNALDPALIEALTLAVERAAQSHPAIVLSGQGGRFSGGLDVPVLLTLDYAGMKKTWRAFFTLMRTLAFSPVPIIAALTGHSPAGGTVLGLFCDRRIFAQGNYIIGLNEVQVGLAVPVVLIKALQYVVGPRRAEALAVPGLLLSAEEALSYGLVDELAPLAEVVPRALTYAQSLLARPRLAMSLTRARARADLMTAFDSLTEEALIEMTEGWFAPEAQATLKALAARLKK